MQYVIGDQGNKNVDAIDFPLLDRNNGQVHSY